jgi:hypothetical protein
MLLASACCWPLHVAGLGMLLASACCWPLHAAGLGMLLTLRRHLILGQNQPSELGSCEEVVSAPASILRRRSGIHVSGQAVRYLRVHSPNHRLWHRLREL